MCDSFDMMVGIWHGDGGLRSRAVLSCDNAGQGVALRYYEDTAKFYSDGDILRSDEFVDETIDRIGEADKWARKHGDVLPIEEDLLLNVIEQVFEMEKKNFFGF